MKRFVYSLIALLCLAGLATAQYEYFMPVYWIGGHVKGARAGEVVYFYKNLTDVYASKPQFTVGPVNGNGDYLLNGFAFNQTFLEVGKKHYVATEQVNGAGGGPVELTVSGAGYDQAAEMEIVTGGGIKKPGTQESEPLPAIKMWFGNRLYQPDVYWIEEKGNKPFVVAPQTELKFESSIDLPYTLAKDVDSYTVLIDGTKKALTTANTSNVNKTYAAGTSQQDNYITKLSLNYKLEEALTDGKHTIAVMASSSGLRGTASTRTEVATVEVMGGPLRVIGIPITFPSPFSITKDKTVTIQYELSGNGNVTVYLNSPTGEILKKWQYDSGLEGGSAGVNKITWDGRSDRGYLAGNAIYLGSIIARDDNRLLAKFKLTIVD